MLTPKQKWKRSTSADALILFNGDLGRLVTVDETWINQFDPE